MRAAIQNNVIVLVFGALVVAAFFSDPYSQYLINLMLVYIVAAQGLNIILGYAGMFAFAHGAFMGIGAYTSALLVTKCGLPFLLALPIAGIAAAVVGCAIGIPAIRVSGLYLAMVTMGFSELFQWILRHWKTVTGGADGVSVPAPVLFGIEFRSDFSTFAIIVIVAFLMTLLAQAIIRSRVGRTLVAVRDSEIAAQCNGIAIAKTKVLAFGISAFYAGIGGALFTLTQHYINPENFSLYQTILQFCMVVVGGAGSLIGPFIGAAILTWLPEILRNAQALQEIGYGLLLIASVIFMPKGLAGLLVDRRLLPREKFASGR